MKLFIDIETLPATSNQHIDYVVKNIKAPSNYKKPEAIERYKKDAREQSIAKTALSGLFGQVYMIGYAIDEGPVSVIYEGNEGDTLSKFCDEIRKFDFKPMSRFVGHNAKDFDVPFLFQRLMINGLKPISRYYDSNPPSVLDTMQMFACGRYKQYYSLEALCIAFGLPYSAGGMDGSQVAQYHADGRHDEVKTYCAGDVEDMRRLYFAITQPNRLPELQKAA